MRFLESLLPKLFITLIPSSGGIRLYGELRKKGKMIKRFEEQRVEFGATLEKEIKTLERESSVSYIALLETEASQGVLHSCRDSEGSDLSNVEKICIEKRWGLFIDKDELFERQKNYKQIGLDLLFSPFSLLASFYEKTLKESDGLYLLLTDDYLIAAVFKDNTLLFGTQRFMQDELRLSDAVQALDRYIDTIQSCVKAFYEAKVDDNMFIERLYIADTLDFDTDLENRLEELLFVEVEKQRIDLSHELVLLCEKELR